MLGSHNSLTYEKPRKFYMNLFNKFAKCQKLSLHQQIDLGVKVFDFRVKIKNYKINKSLLDCVYVVHGPVEYGNDKSFSEALRILNCEAKDSKIYAIIVYDKSFGGSKFHHLYPKLINMLKMKYNDIDFQFVDGKKEWKIIENFKDVVWKDEVVEYWKFEKNIYKNGIFPYNKKKIKQFEESLNWNTLYWHDFIEKQIIVEKFIVRELFHKIFDDSNIESDLKELCLRISNERFDYNDVINIDSKLLFDILKLGKIDGNICVFEVCKDFEMFGKKFFLSFSHRIDINNGFMLTNDLIELREMLKKELILFSDFKYSFEDYWNKHFLHMKNSLGGTFYNLKCDIVRELNLI